MKKFISFLFYSTIVLFPIGILFKIQNIPGGNIAMTLGLLGILIYFIAKIIKDIIKKRIHWLNFSLQIIIVLMSLVLFSKYMYHNFADYPGLIIIPVFIIGSFLYFIKNKTKYTKLSVTTITYLLLTIPLFGIEFYNSPIHYIPKHWYTRYDDVISAPVSLPYSFKYQETEELSIKAFDLNKSKQYLEAITVYEEALLLEPENPILLFGLSESYTMINDLEKAIEILDKTILIDSTFPTFYNNRGLLYYKLGEFNNATKDFNKAIEVDSTNYMPFANLAFVYYHQSNFEESCKCIKKAEQLGLDIEDSNELKRIKKEICR